MNFQGQSLKVEKDIDKIEFFKDFLFGKIYNE